MFNVDTVRLSGTDLELPRMIPVEQRFAAEAVQDLDAEIRTQVARHHERNPLSGKRIAVAAGSRGVARIGQIVRTLVDELLRCGAKPFVVPAMGSHGGATAEGQLAVLADYGITEQSVGVPVVSSMDTVVVAELPDGTPVHFDANAARADGVVVVNRVKPHTDFKAGTESGLAKMLAIGLGKHRGASTLHTHGFGAFGTLIPAVAEAVMGAIPVEFGLAVVENAYEQVARIELVPASSLLSREAELLVEAKRGLPRFLLSAIDVLVVDEIGKEISGAGMDPNITGRPIEVTPGFGSIPVQRIVVLGLTKQTHGNATGLGAADLTTQRCLDQIDFGFFYTNALTSGVPATAKLPIALGDDRAAIMAALHTCRRSTAPPKIVRIRNTLSLTRIEVSESYAREVSEHPDLTALGAPEAWHFPDGALPPLESDPST